MNQPKLCIDCAHFVSDRECQHPSLGINLINGKTKVEWCAVMRLPASHCKPEGLLYVPQEAVIYDVVDLFPNIKGETQ